MGRLNENDWMGVNNILLKMYSDYPSKLFDNSFIKNLQFMLPFQYASLYLHNYEEGGILTRPEGYGFEPGILEQKQKYVNEATPHMWVRFDERCQVVRLSDIYNSEEQMQLQYYQALFQNYRIRHELTLSLAHKSHRVGVFTIFRCDNEGDFTDRDVCITEQLINHIACYIYKAYNFDRFFSESAGIKGRCDMDLLSRKHGLSQRESEVLSSILDGMSIREIADKLCLSETTVKKHSSSIYSKLQINGRSDLFRVILDK